jgi:hypothetical protein
MPEFITDIDLIEVLMNMDSRYQFILFLIALLGYVTLKEVNKNFGFLKSKNNALAKKEKNKLEREYKLKKREFELKKKELDKQTYDKQQKLLELAIKELAGKSSQSEKMLNESACATIKERLGKKPVLYVSTQFIKAGINIDFDVVIRSSVGLDSLAQAPGRCNRWKQ